jgi:hypothetical protein
MRQAITLILWLWCAATAFGQAPQSTGRSSALAAQLTQLQTDLVRTQGEIARLRHALGMTMAPFGVRVVAFEARVPELKERGLIVPDLPRAATETLLPQLQPILRSDLTTMVCDQTLPVMHGHRASLKLGSKYPGRSPEQDEKPFEDGVEIELLATALGADLTSLEVRLLSIRPDALNMVKIARQNVPSLKTVELNTGVELSPGQSSVIYGSQVKRAASQATGVWPFKSQTLEAHTVTLIVVVSLLPPGARAE